MQNQHFDLIVIGGGIVGLSTALHALKALPRLRVLVVEKEDGVARHQSGHNSGVIHSGIYYKPGSLKAQLCVQGAAAMIAFCQEHGIAHEICGKIIVATDGEEVSRLQGLLERGQANGIAGLKMLAAEEIREFEPHCTGLRGLRVPGTGITDYAQVCEKYAALIIAVGGTVQTNTAVTDISHADGQNVVATTQGEFVGRYVINCAGLQSDRVTRMSGQEPDVMIVPFRGEYYDLVPEKEGLVKALIYPVPDPRFPFLGVHFTRRIRGGVDAGPNAVLAFKREGYRRTDFNLRDTAGMLAYPGFVRMAERYWRNGLEEMHRSFSKRSFVKALQRLIPEIKSADLVPDGAGVRAQALRRDGTFVDDFQFVHSPKMLHVCNVPSPAATASLAIGQAIVEMAKQDFGLA